MVKRLTRRKKKGGSYGFGDNIGPRGGVGMEVTQQPQEAGTPAYAQMTGGKRKKKTRKTRGRKMKGGGKYAGGVFPSFGGTGVSGIANFGGVSVRDGTSTPSGGFNNYGAGPGDLKSFKI